MNVITVQTLGNTRITQKNPMIFLYQPLCKAISDLKCYHFKVFALSQVKLWNVGQIITLTLHQRLQRLYFDLHSY